MRWFLRYSLLIALLCVVSRMPATAQAKHAAVPPAAAANPAATSFSKEPVDAAGMEYFEKMVRPVLAQYCYECHSHAAKKSLGNLYVDSRHGMMQGGQHGSILMPGDPSRSRLIEAVLYAKPDLQMPPKAKLPETVIASLSEWVKMGAPWPTERSVVNSPASQDNKAAEQRKRQHWAWQPVRKLPPPAVKHKTWPHNAIDQFILARLEAKGLTPSPRADRRTLIRRAYFDLIGLPPTPEEVNSFLSDTSPDAWEKLIDRLLASRHYGERWGRYWLDIARYGEDQAHSFEPRLYPQGFRYRDWVAHALNTDMPYDRFVKEQIAADLLNEPDRQEQLPALGFFAVGPVYYGDSKMYDQYDDRIDTLTRGFLGLTVACARCHDHKYDPITQKDYYGLAGIFASTAYVEVPLGDGKGSAANGKDAKADGVVNRMELIKAKAEEVDKFIQEHLKTIRERLTPEIARYVAAAWKLHNRRKVDAKIATDAVATAEKVEPLVLDRWMQYLVDKKEKDRPHLAAWQHMLEKEDPHADLSASESALAEVRKIAADLQETVQSLVRRRDAQKPHSEGVTATATDAAKGKADPTALDKSEEALLNEIVGPKGVLTLPEDQFDKLLVGDSKVHYAVIKAELERLKMGSFIHALTEGPKPANVHVLLRGNPETPGDEAPRHFLTVLAGENAPVFRQGSGRLELANAIADKSNPLTARVMVNRVWQHHFGTGIVRTASNFGLLGEKPTHPELLDYLAARFMEHGWSLKSLHREIMLSATYQMSSALDRKSYEIDPENRLLWHMTRRRLEVEAWRDAMLLVSGKLDPAIGGPSVSLSSPENTRRTFYAAVSRHDLDSMLRLFDFPDPNVTADARMSTTVPLQQLFVLNSEFMVQQAKAFAARLTAVPDETDEARIRRAFALAYGRAPGERELRLGLAFLQSTPPTSGQGAAATTPRTGDKAHPLSRWEEYAQVLLSANEFMYVD